jgi:formyltetrahydrofolate-dependent phosphoribosylglycinamide formyltransferase
LSSARLGLLFSGGGRTLENLARRIVEGSLPARITVAVSSHTGAGGIEKAKRYGLRTAVLDYREHREQLSERIASVLDEAGVDWVVLAGFVRHFDYPPKLDGRILNIHPALLPAFGGKGFYGERVHQAVIESGARFSGCTVHFVDRVYDHGPIILQRMVPVLPADTPQSLGERVFREECIALPEALRLCIEGRVEVHGRRVTIQSDGPDLEMGRTVKDSVAR